MNRRLSSAACLFPRYNCTSNRQPIRRAIPTVLYRETTFRVRIVYLTHQFYPHSVGGVEVLTHGLARRARQRGHDVRVITYYESPSGSAADFGRSRRVVGEIPVTEIHFNLSVAPIPAEA